MCFFFFFLICMIRALRPWLLGCANVFLLKLIFLGWECHPRWSSFLCLVWWYIVFSALLLGVLLLLPVPVTTSDHCCCCLSPLLSAMIVSLHSCPALLLPFVLYLLITASLFIPRHGCLMGFYFYLLTKHPMYNI